MTLLAVAWQSLRFVPRDVVDLSSVVHNQQQTFGTDTIADAYEARVVTNDVGDMYTKRLVEQTPVEARTWSKPASSPYPPAALLVNAGLFALTGRTTTGFYLATLCLAAIFLALSLIYFARTRWYLFPLLYVNFGYFGYRFVGVQDGSYLLMLVVLIVALLLARARRQVAHLLVAFAATLKLSPLYYAVEIFRMRRWTAITFVAILVAGLVLPYFAWDNYPYIYTYGAELKGTVSMKVMAAAFALVFAVVLAYVETRLEFDMEERIGWSVVPVALFLSMGLNVARHLLLVLLVPDKRGWRNVTVAFVLGLYALSRGALTLGSVLSIAEGLLLLVLVAHLHAIGWRRVAADLRSPRALLKAWTAPAGTPAPAP